MISIPFSLKVTSFFDWQNIRLGLVGQVASVEETKRTFERDYHRVYLVYCSLNIITLFGSDFIHFITPSKDNGFFVNFGYSLVNTFHKFRLAVYPDMTKKRSSHFTEN